MSNKLIGFKELEERLTVQINNNKLPQALLICGKSGIGKASFAKYFANKILVLGTDKNKIIGQDAQNLDMFIVEKNPEKKNIIIDQIREMQDFMYKTPLISKNKICIIDSACTLNKNSANSLLKILEEPKSNNFFILIAHNISLVIPTIRSRCQIFKVNNLNLYQFKELVGQNHHFTQDEIEVLAIICENSPALAINNGKLYIEIYQNLLLSLNNGYLNNKMIEIISNKELDIDIIERLITFMISRLIKFIENKEQLCYFNEKEAFIKISQKLSNYHIFSLYQEIKNQIKNCKNFYLDKKLTLINIFNLLNSL